MSLPHESNYSKSVADLVHELEINHERVNASGDGARRMYLENERLRTEQRRNWEQYQIAIKERNEFEGELKKVHQNHEGIVCLRNERNRAIQERDEARARGDRVNNHNKRLLEELTPLRRLREAMQKILGCALTTTGCGSDEDSAKLSNEELAECNDMGDDDDE
jgi:hypothetical protein